MKRKLMIFAASVTALVLTTSAHAWLAGPGACYSTQSGVHTLENLEKRTCSPDCLFSFNNVKHNSITVSVVDFHLRNSQFWGDETLWKPNDGWEIGKYCNPDGKSDNFYEKYGGCGTINPGDTHTIKLKGGSQVIAGQYTSTTTQEDIDLRVGVMSNDTRAFSAYPISSQPLGTISRDDSVSKGGIVLGGLKPNHYYTVIVYSPELNGKMQIGSGPVTKRGGHRNPFVRLCFRSANAPSP